MTPNHETTDAPKHLLTEAHLVAKRALDSVDWHEARIAAGKVFVSPEQRATPRPSKDHPGLLDYPAACCVPGCGRQVGWFHVDPAEDWTKKEFTVANPPRFPTRSPYSFVFDGHVCGPCDENWRRALWLRHVLNDIAFQHSEAAKTAPEGDRFVPGPKESDERWAPFSAELASLEEHARNYEAFIRRSDVVKDLSFRAYKAHFFAFLHMRRALLNPRAKSSLKGPRDDYDGTLTGDANSTRHLVGQCLWEYEQLCLRAPRCDSHSSRNEGCERCRALPCGVDAAHLDGRWKALADSVLGHDPVARLNELVTLARRVAKGKSVDALLARANRAIAEENAAFEVAFREVWSWNREHDAACLELAMKEGAVRLNETSRRDVLGIIAAGAAVAAGLTQEAGAGQPAPGPKIKTHPIRCEACEKPHEGSTLGLPEHLTDEEVRQKTAHGTCEPCAVAQREKFAADYRRDYDSVVAKNLTPEQARLVKESGQWATLSPGKRTAVQAVIDDAAPTL